MITPEMKYIVSEMRKLKGYTIIDVALDDVSDPTMPMPALILQWQRAGNSKTSPVEGEKKLAWVQRDPEGNGTGFLLVEDYSQEERA